MTEQKSEPRPAGTGAAQGVLGFHDDTGTGAGGQDAAELGKLRALANLTARHGEEVRVFKVAFVEALLALPDGDAASSDVGRERARVTDPCPKYIGAAVSALARASIIERAAGAAPGTRPVAHGRETKLWRLRDRDAARAWLATNAGPAGDGDGAAAR